MCDSFVGAGPGEHVGRCLLGTAVGVPRTDVLIELCELDVARVDTSAGLAHTVAMGARFGAWKPVGWSQSNDPSHVDEVKLPNGRRWISGVVAIEKLTS